MTLYQTGKGKGQHIRGIVDSHLICVESTCELWQELGLDSPFVSLRIFGPQLFHPVLLKIFLSLFLSLLVPCSNVSVL